MNWGFLTHGSYDFAADSRGYSWGAAVEYYRDDWVLRAGRFAMPKESNDLAMDLALLKHFGDQVELEKAYTLASQPGKLRLLAYRNVANMASFSESLATAAANATTPDLATSRQRRSKRGWGINLEQAITPSIGVFARLGRHDGATETFAFAEIDRSASVGTVISGTAWGRAADAVGLAQAQHGLSKPHRDFLAAGGYGFFVGDGRLRYGPETITEAYYRVGFALPRVSNSALTFGVQHIRNPGYNADRGPVKMASIRLHTEF
jgi:carbohydrate-selective porin OprB